MDIRVGECDAVENPEWDDFVVHCRDPHHEQTSLWGHLQQYKAWNPYRLIIRNDKTIVGGVQILERRVRNLGIAAYVKRGPLVSYDDPLLRRTLIDAIKTFGKKRKHDYLAVVLPYSGGAFEAELVNAEFFVRPDFLPPRTTMMSTIVLDLTSNLDKILASMRSTTRRNIRQGLKRGLRVREGNVADIETFDRLLVELCNRRGVVPNIPTGAFMRDLWNVFSTRGCLKLFISEHDRQPIGAQMIFAMGDWVRAWRIGWSGEYSEMRPNELLHWEVINWAKNHGYKHFDFFGFDTKMAIAQATGKQVSEEQICLASVFKSGFGGEILPLYSGYCYFSNPVIRKLIKMIGIPFMNSRLFAHLMRRFRSTNKHNGDE